MSASFSDFAEALDNSAKYQQQMDEAKLHSSAYWAAHLEKVKWNRRITELVMNCTLLPQQIAALKEKKVRAFDIWFD